MARWKTVSIVGVGLIGASIGQALLRRRLADEVIGIARRETTLRAARGVNAVTHTTIDLARGVAEADLVVVCTPVATIPELVRRAAEHCPEGTLITDAGSTKAAIVAALDNNLPRGCRFLGSHPLAGSEKTGPSYSDAELFEGRVTIIPPTRNTRAEDFDALEEFWTGLGSVVVRMSPEEHDEAIGMTSHFPHLVASLLAGMLPEQWFRFTGTGFLDTTRIAAGDIELWKQILMQNRLNVMKNCQALAQELLRAAQALRDGNEKVVEEILTRGKKNRDALGG